MIGQRAVESTIFRRRQPLMQKTMKKQQVGGGRHVCTLRPRYTQMHCLELLVNHQTAYIQVII